MAINSAAKRKTISGIPFLPPGVTPDAAHGIDWRFSVGLSYIGFVYGIDTAEKRRAVAGLPFLPMGPGVTPNSAQDLEWRSQAAWGYRVIEEEIPVVSSGSSRFFRKYVMPHSRHDKYRSVR